MRRLCAGSLAALSVMSFALPAVAGGLEAAVLEQMNFARTRPAEYARAMRQDPGLHEEDPAAVEEALRFLARQKPLPPLSHDDGLAKAAQFHAAAQGRTRDIGHVSPDGKTLGQRLQIHGVHVGLAAENISYGYDDARAVVRQLIVDSGIPDRGHRTNIFGPAYDAAGVSCGGHREYRTMCVIDFAGARPKR
jgi:uncharacterized protein YkwD